MVNCHCGKQAIYNVRGEKKGLFCSDHKTPEMVNAKNKTCESAGCEKQPTYNVRGTKKGLLCADHKTPEMVDVKHETCESAGWCDLFRPLPFLRRARCPELVLGKARIEILLIGKI